MAIEYRNEPTWSTDYLHIPRSFTLSALFAQWKKWVELTYRPNQWGELYNPTGVKYLHFAEWIVQHIPGAADVSGGDIQVFIFHNPDS